MNDLMKRNKAFVDSGEKLVRSNFKEVNLLGSGSFAKVYKVTSLSTGKSYAMKILSMLKIKNLKLVNQLWKEISTLSKCNHENVIYLYASFEEDNLAFLIQELAEGSLFEKMAKERRFSEEQVAAYMIDIIKAVSYLHSLTPPVLHRDLKPENILLLNDRCKLADFGWSSTDDDYRNTYCGTFDYLSPEMIRGTGHNEKLDVWTLGILMYELLEGKPPFKPKEKTLDKRLAAKMTERNILAGAIEFERPLSREAIDAIKTIVNVNENLRPTARGVLELEFFKKHRGIQVSQTLQPPTYYPTITSSQATFSQPITIQKAPPVLAETNHFSQGPSQIYTSTVGKNLAFTSPMQDPGIEKELADLRAQNAYLSSQNEDLKRQLSQRSVQEGADKSLVGSLSAANLKLDEEIKSLRSIQSLTTEKIQNLSAQLASKDLALNSLSKTLSEKSDLTEHSLKLLKEFAETITSFCKKYQIGSQAQLGGTGQIDLFNVKSDIAIILADYERLKGSPGNSTDSSRVSSRYIASEEPFRYDSRVNSNSSKIGNDKVGTTHVQVTRWANYEDGGSFSAHSK